MKKKILLIIILASAVSVSFILMGCTPPNVITEESFRALAYDRELEVFMDDNGSLSVTLDNNNATVWFTQFDSVETARDRFTVHEQHINSYSVRRRVTEINVSSHNILRANAGGYFYAVYRIESGVLFAKGLETERDMIRDFISALTQ